MSNPFSEKYRTVSLLQLADVIINSGNYNEAAVAAAREELQRRNISTEEFDQARNEILFRKEKNDKREEKFRKISDEYAGILDPKSEKSPDQILKLVCAGLAGLLLYKMYTSYGILIYTVRYSNFDNPAFYIWFLSFGFTGAIMVLLWNKIKAGYYIFYGWIILNLAMTLINLYYIWSILDFMDTLWPPNPSIINLSIFGAFFWVANYKKFKQAFRKIPKEEEIEKMIKEINTN